MMLKLAIFARKPVASGVHEYVVIWSYTQKTYVTVREFRLTAKIKFCRAISKWRTLCIYTHS